MMRIAIAVLLATLTVTVFAQQDEAVMLFDCDAVEGVTITGGQKWPDSKLEVNADATWISEGEGSLHLSSVSPADAGGNSYLDLSIALDGVDFTKRALLFDAWTSTPDVTRALYVRAYDAANDCVLSFRSWGGPLSAKKTSFELSKGFGDKLGWEPKMVEADDLSGVARLRFYVGTSEKGAPFDLYLDNIRIAPSVMQSFADVTEVKERFPQTTLVEDGQPRAMIIVPDDGKWDGPAANLQDMVRTATGANLPITKASEIDDEQLRESTTIIFGNVGNNRHLLYLYSHYYAFADAAYPGDDGYEIRVVHDPWATGNNVLVVGASSVEGAAAGIVALDEQLDEGADLTIGPLLLTKLGADAQRRYGSYASATLGDKWMDGQRTTAENSIKTGAHTGLFSQIAKIGLRYQLTQREEYAAAFVWLLRRAKEHRDSNPTTYGGPWGFDSDFPVYRVVPQWDVVEECPALTDDERLEATRIIAEWVEEACAPKAASTLGSTHVRHNHQTFPALGCYYTGNYFDKYYHAGEGKQWLRIADAAFTFQSTAFKGHEDCNGYQWLTLYHTMRYCLARPDLTFFENENVRRIANYAIGSMDNFGQSVTYGDTGTYVGWWSEMPFLRGAEWYYRDGRAAWALERKTELSGRQGISEFAVVAEPVEPTDLIGTRGFPLEPLYHASMGGPKYVALEQAIDKVVMRDSFDPEDQYLLLDGLNNGGHKHYDGNSISRMADNGRIWLADASYMNSLPKYHSTILALKDGKSATLPPFCELEHLRDTESVGYSETTLRDYAGVDWHRNILWRKGEWFVVADELQANEAGDYSFRVLWQTIGEVTLGDDGLDVEQAGQHCAIRMTEDLRFTLHDDATYGANWSRYEFIEDPVVRTLTGIWNGRLEAGEQVTLFTLLHASGEEVSPLHMTRLNPNTVAVSGDDEAPAIVAVGGADGHISLVGQIEADAHALLLTPGAFTLFDVSELTYQGTPAELGAAQDISMALGIGDVTVYPRPGRTAVPDTDTVADFADDVAAADDKMMRDLILAAVALAPPAEAPTVAGGDAPALAQLWSYREMLDSYLLTNNRGAFEAVEAGLTIACDTEPLALNVFSQEAGANTLDNIADGVLLQTDGGVQFDDDQEITIDLALDNVYEIDSITLRAWFATSSSKNKLFQLGRAVIEASDDGFAADTRPVLDFTDEEIHGNWGAPGHAPRNYAFEELDTHARNLRLKLTPRPGTALYIAEVEVRGNREGLELDAATMQARGLPTHTFADLWAADVDGDGADEVIAGATNGKVYLFESNGKLAWSHELSGRVNAVCAADLNGDGELAIIAGSNEGTVDAFDATGESLWTHEIAQYHGPGRVTDVFPADLTGDGGQAVVFGAESWRYYAIDAAGDLIWKYESVRKGRVGTAVDLDGDGKQEIVCGTEYHWWPVVKPDGSKHWSYSTRTGPGVNDVTAADITGDGTPEVLFGGEDGNIHTLSATGKLLWQFATGDEITSVTTVGPDDGVKTLIAGSRIFNLYAFDGAGQTRWVTDMGAPVMDIATLRRANGQSIAATLSDGGVYTVDPADGAITGRSVADGSGLVLVAADLDGDGSDEIILSGADGNLTALR